MFGGVGRTDWRGIRAGLWAVESAAYRKENGAPEERRRGGDCGWYKKRGVPSPEPLVMGRLPTLPHLRAVPSALAGLTSLFGMGRGGAPQLLPPCFSCAPFFFFFILCVCYNIVLYLTITYCS